MEPDYPLLARHLFEILVELLALGSNRYQKEHWTIISMDYLRNRWFLSEAVSWSVSCERDFVAWDNP